MNPQRIGRYEIKSEVGRGGMATVYLAWDPRFERDVAIKVLPPTLTHDPQFRARFEREAKTIALLEHPAIVPVYDYGEDDEQVYIVMRFMSGGSLADRLKAGPMCPPEAIGLICRLAPALEVAHGRGIVHRDLKPGNILFDQYGHAYLSDFGLVHLTEQGAMTLTGEAVLGTPAYMSPEQVRGDHEIDGRSDLYSLGIILYQMLTGQVPFQSDTPAKTMLKHILDPVPWVLDCKPDLPPSCAAVLDRVLAKQPEERFATASEMASALEAALKPAGPVSHIFSAGQTIVLAPSRGSNGGSSSTDITPPKGLPPVQLAKKRTAWGLAGVALVGMAVLVLVVAVSFYFMTRRGSGALAMILPPTPTPFASPTLPSISTAEPSLQAGGPVLVYGATQLIPTAAVNPTALPTPTETAAPTQTPTQIPTASPTAVPLTPVIGGADKIAFLNGNDVWIADLDGSDLLRLTLDGGEKFHLQWSPDGQAVNYIVGKCVQTVDINTQKVEDVACFGSAGFLEAFEVSPDGKQVAISLNRELYIVPYDRERLAQARSWKDLKAMAGCQLLAPYTHNDKVIAIKSARWSSDGQQLAIVRLAVEGGQQVDLIQLLDISRCVAPIDRLDEFPATRFKMEDYEVSPYIQNFGWDGTVFFALTSYKRNDGFGDLWIYSSELHRGYQANPIADSCCYRDPQFSPDGSQLVFVFQDMKQAPAYVIQLYYVTSATLGTGLAYTPIPLPEGFFADPRSKPQPALRPAP